MGSDSRIKHRLCNNPLLTRGTGQPVLLVHSSLSSKIQWLPLIQKNAGCQWWAMDLLGYGQNAPVAISDTVFSLRDEVAWIDQHLPTTTDLTLVGHSYGGAVAMAWAMQHPHRVKQLVLYEPVLFGLLAGDDPGLQEIGSLTQSLNQITEGSGCWEQRAKLFVDYWSGNGAFQRLPKMLKMEIIRVMPKVPLDFAAIMQLDFDLDDILSSGFSMHLIMGKNTRLSAHSVIEVLSRYLPKCHRHVLEGVGHMGPVTHRDVVNPLILSLVGR